MVHGVQFVQRKSGDEDKKKGNGKSSVSTKRSRAAAIHNQSERVCSVLLSLSDINFALNLTLTLVLFLKFDVIIKIIIE